ALLSVLKPGWRLQVQWTNDSDFLQPLQRYRDDTLKHGTNEWSVRQLNERFVRFWRMAEEGVLRRERLRLYFTTPIDAAVLGQRSGRLTRVALFGAYAEQFLQLGPFTHTP